MSEVWLQMSDTNIDRENPSDLPALDSKCRNTVILTGLTHTSSRKVLLVHDFMSFNALK